MSAKHRAVEDDSHQPKGSPNPNDGDGRAVPHSPEYAHEHGSDSADAAESSDASDSFGSFDSYAVATESDSDSSSAADHVPPMASATDDSNRDDDPFASFVIKADLTASHRGYNYDADDDESSFDAEPLPPDLDQAGQALVLERDPDELLGPVTPSYESADEHLAASSDDLDLEHGTFGGWSHDAAVPWVGDSSTWESLHPTPVSGIDFHLARPKELTPPSDETLSDAPPPPPPYRATPHMLPADEVAAIRRQFHAENDSDFDADISDTSVGELTVGMVTAAGNDGSTSPTEARTESKPRVPLAAARGAGEKTEADTVVDLHMPSSLTASTRVGVAPASTSANPSPPDVEAEELLRVFEQLQQDTERMLNDAARLLTGDTLKAHVPGSSTKLSLSSPTPTTPRRASTHANMHVRPHASTQATATAEDLSQDLGRLQKEAELLAKRYQYVRQSYGRILMPQRQVALQHVPMCARVPRDVTGLEFGLLYKPDERAGTDISDVIPLSDDGTRWGVVLGEISNHGITATVVVAMARKLLNVFLREGADPAEALRRANANLLGDVPSGTHITALVGILDVNEASFTYARAGHPAPLLYNPVRGREPSLLHVGGMALAMAQPDMFDGSIKSETVELQENDTLVLFSDGAFELSNNHQQRFGMKRFLDLVRDFGAGSANFLIRKLHSNVQRFRAGATPEDDLTVLVVKFRPDLQQTARNPHDRDTIKR